MEPHVDRDPCPWSLADFFLPAADPWRPEAWASIRATPHLTYKIVTKRPERIAAHLPHDWGMGYPNVWLGVRVEHRRWLSRMTALGDIPAVVKYVSLEPLLGPLHDLTSWLVTPNGRTRLINWVIAGGESGPGYRPMQLSWLGHVVQACAMAGVPLWVTQDSGLHAGQQGTIPDAVWALKQVPVRTE